MPGSGRTRHVLHSFYSFQFQYLFNFSHFFEVKKSPTSSHFSPHMCFFTHKTFHIVQCNCVRASIFHELPVCSNEHAAAIYPAHPFLFKNFPCNKTQAACLCHLCMFTFSLLWVLLYEYGCMCAVLAL